jgi:hypothetical protein
MTTDYFNMYKITTVPIKESPALYECLNKYFITELIIMPESVVCIDSSSDKCRVSKAIVSRNYEYNYVYDFLITYSIFDNKFMYKMNEIVKPDSKFFGYDDWLKSNEPENYICKPGIHAFFTKKQAMSYICDGLSELPDFRKSSVHSEISELVNHKNSSTYKQKLENQC